MTTRRHLAASFALLCLVLIGTSRAVDIRLAPFTDTAIADAVKDTTVCALPEAKGTNGKGVALTEAAPIEWPGLKRDQGYIGFWIRPHWDGNDRQEHRLLRIGDPGGNGLAIVKSDRGLLRYVMASPERVTVARADVSTWKAGEWHHVVVTWFSRKEQPTGLPLWIDRVAEDGPVAGGCTFLDPEKMGDKRVWIGDASSDADLDELILRYELNTEGGAGQTATVYRDYFRTAPYDAIEVDGEPLRVPSDKRAVAGHEKQFGLKARREGVWEPVTDYAVRYGQWADFDAKPFIEWASTDESVAAVDKNGRIKANKPGTCVIEASFRGMRARLEYEVVSPDKPDLDLICIELLPRYRADALKKGPAPGEAVTARVRVGSFGLEATPEGAEVRLDLIPVAAEDSYRFDPRIGSVETLTGKVDKALAPGEESAVELEFEYPSKPMWMRVRLDPANHIDEFCEANNEVTERTDARPIECGYNPTMLDECLTKRRINHVGSLSFYDWWRAQKLRMDVMMREAVWPTTGPYGVEEAYRIDGAFPIKLAGSDEEPYNKASVYFDGGFPVDEPVDLMAVDSAIIHEFGHCILSQPDLYGYPLSASNVLLTDDEGRPYAGTPLLPIVTGDQILPASHATATPCWVAYTSLMDYCHLWLHPSQAGHIMYYRGYRQDRFWGTQGRLIPSRANWLVITDASDRPMKGAAVYVYHVVQAPVQDAGAKYFPDRPKFIGHTDDEGRFTFPGETDEDWDDPATDEVDGSISVWNPFGGAKTDTAFTPNVWTVEGLLLLKIVSGSQTEFHAMDLTEFNEQFLSGHQACGVYQIRTSLQPSAGETPIVRKPVPEAVREVNKQPVAVAPTEITVKCGEEFDIDGSKSNDPEGQPLYYRWNVQGQWLAGDLTQSPVLHRKAPDKPGTEEYRFWVMDGVRCSEAVTVKVTFVE